MKTSETVESALQAFPRWMNRPVARVQVYSLHLARKMFGLELPWGFFWNASTRRALQPKLAMFMRREVAAMLRVNRRNKAVMLPTYTEELQGYSKPEIYYPAQEQSNLHAFNV